MVLNRYKIRIIPTGKACLNMTGVIPIIENQGGIPI